MTAVVAVMMVGGGGGALRAGVSGLSTVRYNEDISVFFLFWVFTLFNVMMTTTMILVMMLTVVAIVVIVVAIRWHIMVSYE